MRSITRCDFCEGEAAGTFEIVPPELEPTEDEQRRVMLCGACRNRLGGLLEPLFARLDGAENAPRADSSDESTGSNESVDSDDQPDGADDAADAPTDAFEAPTTVERDDAEEGVESAEEDEEGSEVTVQSAETTESDRPPRSYGKVVRLLRNREFPMERDAVESLAAGAYDLQPNEVDAIVDYAISEEEFREIDGQLQRV
ncbi:hypothetical protein OB905_13515 [Halobacteria archaeon AArc-dxtr1]|nr:hypothetical protein [Halobacteria archaeon AArc-dxtr1]